MRAWIAALLLVAACTADDAPPASPDAAVVVDARTVDAETAERMEGPWTVHFTCIGACTFSPLLVRATHMVVDGLSLTYELPNLPPEKHTATASVGCLVVAGAVDETGTIRSPYELCRVGDTAADTVTWTTANGISGTWRLDARK